MYSYTNKMSHSTCSLNLSGMLRLLALLGPGLCHSRQTRHVSQICGIYSKTFSATPARLSSCVICLALACHQRTCSLRNVARMADSLSVRSSLVTLPISKVVQSPALTGLVPWSCQVLRCLGTMSGPRLPDDLSAPAASTSSSAGCGGGSVWTSASCPSDFSLRLA